MTRKPIFYLTLMIVLTTSFRAHAQDPLEERSKLIGVWQNSPELGSGWSTNYQFLENGRFRLNHNQMDCADSILWEGGNYSISNDSLLLTFDSISFISGGMIAEPSGSCASEYMIVGGEVVSTTKFRKEHFHIAFVKPKTDYDYLQRILIQDKEWFRMLHNPADY